MAIDFSATSGDELNLSDDTAADQDAQTYLAWVYHTAQWDRGLVSGFRIILGPGANLAGTYRYFRQRATTNTDFKTDSSFYVVDKWYFVAITFEKDVATEVRFYRGDLRTIVSEYTSLSLTTDGVGAMTPTEGDLSISGSNQFPGYIANVMYVNRVMTIGEIRRVQYSMAPVPNTGWLFHLWDNLPVHHDWSRNGVTAVKAGSPSRAPFHVPITFRPRRRVFKAPAAAAVTRWPRSGVLIQPGVAA